MEALQLSPKIESLYGLGRQARKLYGSVWNFATCFSNRAVQMFVPDSLITV